MCPSKPAILVRQFGFPRVQPPVGLNMQLKDLASNLNIDFVCVGSSLVVLGNAAEIEQKVTLFIAVALHSCRSFLSNFLF